MRIAAFVGELVGKTVGVCVGETDGAVVADHLAKILLYQEVFNTRASGQKSISKFGLTELVAKFAQP